MPSESKVNVLLVDDHPENLLALEGILESLGHNLVKAISGTEALKCLLKQDFAVILLDVQMPDMDGFETATLIRQRKRSSHTPIIFLTAFSSSNNMVEKGYSLGAVDYLFKPIEPEILKCKVTAFIELFQKRAEVEQQAAELAAMNAELKKSEELFRCLNSCSPAGIFLTDIDGNCTYTNPHYQKIYGMTEAESLGDGWAKAIHPEDREQVLSEWYSLSHVGKEYSSEFRIITSSGVERWVSVCSSVMHSDDNNIIGHVGTVNDITERKRSEAEHIEFVREQTARQEAETANRLKDEFLATLSHELRTPLNSILGWAKLLRKQKFDEKNIARGLETIERNALLQTQLINDILDVSRIIRGKLHLTLSPVNVESLIKQALHGVRLEVEAKKLTLNYIIEDVLSQEDLSTSLNTQNALTKYVVLGDIHRLHQIFTNLLNNAIKFTPLGGEVVVNMSLAVDKINEINEEKISQASTTFSTQFVLIQVRDTGVGIAPEFLPHVFERFRQADGSTTKNYGGLGLGLAIVRYLVELHNGSVSVNSPGIGQGTTFIVKLPLMPTNQDVLSNNQQESPPHSGRGDITIRNKPVSGLLELNGY